jgi:hypothetical protein
LADDAQHVLDDAKISFTRKPKFIYITIDAATISGNPDAFRKLAVLVRRSWDKDA